MAKKSLLKATPDYEDYTENVVKIDDEVIKELGIMAGEYITRSCCDSCGGCNSGSGCGSSEGCGCNKKQSLGGCSTKSCCKTKGEGCNIR